jgi:drug/metabolite transporter (DMT)-like permease
MKYRLLIVLAASLWGLDGILRTTLYTLPPSVVVFAEHFIGFVILSLILIFQHPKASRRFKSGRNAYYIVIVSLFSGVVGTMAFTAALARVQYIPVSIVFLIQKLQPIFTIIAAHIVLKERPARTFWYYATIALVAGYFMTFPQGVQIDANTQLTYTILRTK